MNHMAIRRAYPNAATIDNTAGAFDASGNKIELDQAKVNTAEAELTAEAAAIAYQGKRAAEYPAIGDQLDMIYKAGQGGDAFQAAIKAVKDKYPKPE